MSYVVAKAFKTVQRRFFVGQPVTRFDCSDAAHFAALRASGFISEVVDASAKGAEAKDENAPAKAQVVPAKATPAG